MERCHTIRKIGGSMKSCAGLVCLGAMLATAAWAIPCDVGGLDTYIALGSGGCTVGNLPLTFKNFNFAVINSAGGVIAAIPSEILVTPTSEPQGTLQAARLTFTSSKFNASGAEQIEYEITYTVDPPPVIIESDMDLSADSPVAPGRVNILKGLCIGAPFIGNTCDGSQQFLNVFHNGTPTGAVRLHDEVFFGGTSILGVRLNINLQANGASSQFNGVSAGTLYTPEPATPLAVAGGLFALAGIRKARLEARLSLRR